MEHYRALMRAARLLGETLTAIGREDGPSVVSPAWRMVRHAQGHLLEQAEALLRGSEQ